jgi:hypothetical protein
VVDATVVVAEFRYLLDGLAAPFTNQALGGCCTIREYSSD